MYTLPFMHQISFPLSFIPTSQMKQNPCYLLTFLIQRKQTMVKFRIQVTRKLNANTSKVIALFFLERGYFLLLLIYFNFFSLRFRYCLIRKLKSSLILMSKMYDSKTFKMSTTRTVGTKYPWVTVFRPQLIYTWAIS